jgi:hypothetical protein
MRGFLALILLFRLELPTDLCNRGCFGTLIRSLSFLGILLRVGGGKKEVKDFILLSSPDHQRLSLTHIGRYRGVVADSFLPQFIADFVLSLVDIITTSQPRRIDAVLDGVTGLGYLALFVVSLVFTGASEGVIISEAAIIAR